MNVDDPRLTAYALDELAAEEKADIEAAITESPEAERFITETRELGQMLKAEYRAERESETVRPANLIDIRGDRWFWAIARPLAIAALLAVAALIAGVAVFSKYRAPFLVAESAPVTVHLPAESNVVGPAEAGSPEVAGELGYLAEDPGTGSGDTSKTQHSLTLQPQSAPKIGKGLPTPPYIGADEDFLIAGIRDDRTDTVVRADPYNRSAIFRNDNDASTKGAGQSLNAGRVKADRSGGVMKREALRSGIASRGSVTQAPAAAMIAAAPPAKQALIESELNLKENIAGIREQNGDFSTAAYDHILENPFLDAASNPLSTFSIDVDTASYSNIRRFINDGSLPPKDAVRVEEMINYFTYDYAQPDSDKPFSINVDVAGCPWQLSHRLVRIGLKGRNVAVDKRGPSNLVFLLDVSGSMTPPERLPLVKQAMRLLVEKLTENDRVAIVVYAGASGLVLPSITGDHKEQILSAIERLQPGGSTNGAEGIQLAYRIAGDNFTKGGVNRVILATDGDFNVGVTSQGDLVRLIEEKAKTGVFLSVLGVGTDNLKDSTMQKLADKGNGNYAYLDSLDEARKVLVEQMNGTLVTIAKDVKIQVEFNPARVASYRLIGYEKRALRKEDFNNDKVDAGEIGAGHTVTALYEVVPVGVSANPSASIAPVDPLKYSANAQDRSQSGTASNEILTVKLRHKKPDGDKSELIERAVTDGDAKFESASADFKFAAAVAEFGMVLRDSEHKGNGTFGAVLEWAQEGKGSDGNGYRAGFIELVRKAQALKKG
jgi:Ca-activated chloride channel homolog